MKHIIICILLVPFSHLFAEKNMTISQITFYTGTNSRFEFHPTESSSFLDNYWHKGINFGIEAEIKISSSVFLNPTYELNYYKFDTYFYEGKIPEIYLISYVGENSYIHRYLLNVKFISSKSSLLNPYFTTGIGYVYEDIGQIEIKEGYMSYGERDYVKIFDEKNYFVHNVGVGLKISIMNSWPLKVESRYYSNYSDRFHYSINIGFGIKL